MADACGLISAAKNEKVWIDKSSYDKAECLHQEKLAKVLPAKITDNSVIMSQAAEPQSQPSSGSKKSKKVKDNKLAGQQQQQQQEAIAAAEPAKSTKSSKKNKKKAAEAASAESSRHETAEAAAGEPTTAATGKKLKAKEVKDENNKADKVLNSRKVKETKEENNEADRAFIMSKKASGKEAKDENNEADWKRSISESDKLSEPEKERPAGREHLSSQGNQSFPLGSLANEVAKARLHIKQSLQCMDGIAALAGLSDCNVSPRITSLEKENQGLKNNDLELVVQELKTVVTKLDSRVKDLEGKVKSLESAGGSAPALQICPQKPAAKPAEKKEEKKDDDEDVDLFGSDSEGEDEEAAKIREERLAAYAAKKSKKPTLIAKSSLILDVKPWDDETDMGALEAEVRKIQTDGLLWGAAKLVPVAYNIKKLQITCVVEDDKVSIDWLTEEITNIEDYVQSVDIAAFNKI